MLGKTIMIQGTGSHVGKSVLTTALCRIFFEQGYKVAPFKAQNMALNSYVTESGGEIGYAQFVQAEACGLKPETNMNPILLKPNSDTGAQVIVNGISIGNMNVDEYMAYKKEGKKIVAAALKNLRERFDLVIIEGAGSPAEVNLKKNDIANMGVAEIADAPVLLVGDIDRGGVFAWFLGTMQLLTRSEQNRIKGLIINQFRGKRALLDPAILDIEKRVKKPVLGVVPYLHEINIPAEDGVSLQKNRNKNSVTDREIDIVIIKYPRISNFTDFDALKLEREVNVRFVDNENEFGNPDQIILPGSKNTIQDMKFLNESGLADCILSAAKNGVFITGICGGFQMLGKKIFDPENHEGSLNSINGLGLINSVTTIKGRKQTFQITGVDIKSGIEIKGYEVHMGETKSEGNPLFKIMRSGEKEPVLDGHEDPTGLIWGTYIHGLFESDRYRSFFLNKIHETKGLTPKTNSAIFNRKTGYDKLAEAVKESLDMEKINKIIFG